MIAVYADPISMSSELTFIISSTNNYGINEYCFCITYLASKEELADISIEHPLCNSEDAINVINNKSIEVTKKKEYLKALSPYLVKMQFLAVV